MKIAIVSFNSLWEDKKSNLIRFEKIVRSLNGLTEFVVFPEMTLTGFSISNLDLAEDPKDSICLKKVKEIAKKNNMNIIFGLMTSEKSNIYNSCIAVNSEGEIECSYEKIHLFSFANENEFLKNGKKLQSTSWPGGWGLSICFDLRFPEIYQYLSKKNLILINIANWPNSRIDHWFSLLKARAIENQSFMVGVNRSGIDGKGLEYDESSCIYSPEGDKLNYDEISKEVKIFDINLEDAISCRTRFPFKVNRINSFYKNLYK